MKQKNLSIYKKSGFWTTLFFITALVAFVMYINIGLANRTEKIWIQSEGQLRLSNITSGVENNLVQAENYANSYATQLELLLKETDKPDDESIYDFIYAQNKMLSKKTNGQCFSTYVAYRDQLYIEDFVPDESFHLSERVWYVGAKKNQGNVYITAPYVDASTGSMCYSVSMLLDDGETIVGLDFYMDAIQQYIEKMNEQIDGISMIVNEGGMIVGHNDSSLLGQDYTVLKDYKELIEKVFNLYGNYFEYTVKSGQDIRYTVFSDKTTYGWYLIVCLPSANISFGAKSSTVMVSCALVLLWLIFILLYVRYYRKRVTLQQQLSAREHLIQDISDELREPVAEMSQQIQFADEIGDEFQQSLHLLTNEIKQNVDRLAAYQAYDEGTEKNQKEKSKLKNSKKYKHYSMAIVAVLLIASVISVAVNSYTQFRFINAYMENESDTYYSQTKSWIDTNITITNDLAKHLGAQPDFYKDYEKAVQYLDAVVRDNADISVAYIVNPVWEHAVIMNNGWESDDPNWHVEERDWYVDTVLSESGFNISTPYQDEQTGMYCVTFSQIVYDEEGNTIGLIGIDFYMDKLTKILGESYTPEGYAFLTDPSYIILNHPSQDYQMSLESSVNCAETEYRNALVSESLTLMKDYDQKYVVALAQREPRSGFTVVTVRNAWLIYGTLVLTDIVLIVVFFISILFVLIIAKYMSKQQEELNQELRIAADKAIEAGKAKSRFLAQMSHEIRTPINAVLGMNEMILREAKEEEILNYVSNAYNAGNALLSIINDVLDISKIEAGRMEIVKAEYDIHSLVSDCYHLTADRAAKKNLQLSVSVEETLPSKLYGDMFHLRQVIVNFLTNAIKYTNEGSVELAFEGKNTGDDFILKVSVKDTGIGLTDERKEKLFTSFQRFDLERNQSVEGTGLGLSICKQIAELMGGTVEVESVYGKGSTFSCLVPQKIISDTPVGTVVLDSPIGRRNEENKKVFTAPDARILVVDDVEMNLLVFTGLLKEHRLQIDKALSGKQCLDLVQKEKYDIIFMDHMMPEMDGMETFACMKETEHRNSETPVIMLTANAISGEKEKYLSAGFVSYLTKPIQSDKLEEALIQYLPEDKIIWTERETSDEPAKEAKPDFSDNGKKGNPVSDFDKTYINRELGLSFVGHNEEAYREILESYLKGSQKTRGDIRQYYEEENWKNYVTRVHALKSTSLTIGAEELSELAKELELAGKSEEYDTIRDKNEALLDLYEKVLAAAEEILNQADSKSNQSGLAVDEASDRYKSKEAEAVEEITKEKLKEYEEKIRNAVQTFNVDEIMDVCRELSAYSYNGIELSDIFAPVMEKAEDFECEDAGKLAELAFESLNQE